MFLPLHDSAPLRVIRFQLVTGLIILANVLVFLAVRYGTSPVEAARIPLSFGAIPAVLTDRVQLGATLQVIPEQLTVVTYMFLHGGWLHLIGNMAFMWVFADNVEDGFGHAGFVLFYLVCGVAAALAHVAMSASSQVPLIGASGAVAGVLAAYMLLFPQSRVLVLLFMRIPVRLTAFWILTGWFVFQVISALAATPGKGGVAWWAHVGGFMTGFVLTLILRPFLLRRLAAGERHLT